jgi:hypothetical protein
VECKTSVSDFLADKAKYQGWKHPEYSWTMAGIRSSNRPKEQMIKAGYEPVTIPSMGARRWFMCEAGLLSSEMIEKHYPDHGLLLVFGRSVKIERRAPDRESPNYKSETRYLRMRLLHLRHNMLRVGCSVDFDEATLFMGQKGITLPNHAP